MTDKRAIDGAICCDKTQVQKMGIFGRSISMIWKFIFILFLIKYLGEVVNTNQSLKKEAKNK